MSTDNQRQIKDLTPSIKGQFVLNFEIAQIIKRDESADSLECRIVDQTGIINAYFERYAKFIKQGSVFQIKNFRCKVVDHHLRLQMIKTTVISKIPMKICFKDMDNDLSQKFYVAANKNKEVQQQNKNVKQEEKLEAKKEDKKDESKQQKANNKDKQEQKSQTVQNNQGRRKKAGYKEKQIEKKQKNIQSESKTNNKNDKQQKRYVQKKYVQRQKEPQNGNKKDKQFNKSKEGKQSNNYRNRKASEKINTNQTRVTGRQNKWQQASKNKQSKIKYIQKFPQIKIKDLPNFQELEASFCVFINLRTKIAKQNYFLCKVADQTGATYFEFQPKMEKHLQDSSWYKLIGYKIYGDRDYGFIASQQSNSSFKLLQDYDKTTNNKLLWR